MIKLITRKQKNYRKRNRKKIINRIKKEKIKDRVSPSNKPFFFERKIDSDENERRKREIESIILIH